MQLINKFFLLLLLLLTSSDAYDSEINELAAKLTYSNLNTHQISIDIPTSFSPWKSIDIIQYNNKFNLQWNSSSVFLNCEIDDSNCFNSNDFIDLGDESDVAATYELQNPLDYNFTYIKFISPILSKSLDGDYNVSFVVVIEYDDDDDNENQYAQINTFL